MMFPVLIGLVLLCGVSDAGWAGVFQSPDGKDLVQIGDCGNALYRGVYVGPSYSGLLQFQATATTTIPSQSFFRSANGQGTIQWTLSANSNTITGAWFFSYQQYGNGFAEEKRDGSSWAANRDSTKAAAIDLCTNVGPLSTLTGTYTTADGTNSGVQLCHPSGAFGTAVVQGELATNPIAGGIAGLLVAVWSPLSNQFNGYYRTQWKQGVITIKPQIGTKDLLGTINTAPGGVPLSTSVPTVSWPLTFTSSAITVPACIAFSDGSTVVGSYTSEYGEAVNVCHPPSPFGPALLQAQYVSSQDTSNGVVAAMYLPSRNRWIGAFHSQNGPGDMYWAIASAVTGSLSGGWSYRSDRASYFQGGATSGSWGLSRATSSSNPAVCIPFEQAPKLGAYYQVVQRAESISICQLNTPMAPAIIQATFTGSGYTGRMLAIWLPSSREFRGHYRFTNDGTNGVMVWTPQNTSNTPFLPFAPAVFPAVGALVALGWFGGDDSSSYNAPHAGAWDISFLTASLPSSLSVSMCSPWRANWNRASTTGQVALRVLVSLLDDLTGIDRSLYEHQLEVDIASALGVSSSRVNISSLVILTSEKIRIQIDFLPAQLQTDALVSALLNGFKSQLGNADSTLLNGVLTEGLYSADGISQQQCTVLYDDPATGEGLVGQCTAYDDESPSSISLSSGSNLWIVIGIVIGAVLLCVCCALCWWRRRRLQQVKPTPPANSAVVQEDSQSLSQIEVETRRGRPTNPSSDSRGSHRGYAAEELRSLASAATTSSGEFSTDGAVKGVKHAHRHHTHSERHRSYPNEAVADHQRSHDPQFRHHRRGGDGRDVRPASAGPRERRRHSRSESDAETRRLDYPQGDDSDESDGSSSPANRRREHNERIRERVMQERRERPHSDRPDPAFGASRPPSDVLFSRHAAVVGSSQDWELRQREEQLLDRIERLQRIRKLEALSSSLSLPVGEPEGTSPPLRRVWQSVPRVADYPPNEDDDEEEGPHRPGSVHFVEDTQSFDDGRSLDSLGMSTDTQSVHGSANPRHHVVTASRPVRYFAEDRDVQMQREAQVDAEAEEVFQTTGSQPVYRHHHYMPKADHDQAMPGDFDGQHEYYSEEEEHHEQQLE